jgi:chromate transporter
VKTLVQIFFLFSSLSLLSIGGGNSVLPEMHRQSVGTYDWLTDNQFADVFAISQAGPGPSILIVTLIGYKAAGILAGVLATIAVILPAAIVVYLVTLFWQHAEKSPLRHEIENGFAPLTVGLILASAYIMGKSIDYDRGALLLTSLCALIFIFTRTNPLIIVALAGLIGFLGWV